MTRKDELRTWVTEKSSHDLEIEYKLRLKKAGKGGTENLDRGITPYKGEDEGDKEQ